jgi:hypothetical protein
MKGKGIMINDSNDLAILVKRDSVGKILSGLVIGDTTFQNQEQIILAQPGTIKHAPLVGVGVADFLDDEVPDNLLRAVRTQLAADGQKVKSVGFDQTGQLVVDANYNQ